MLPNYSQLTIQCTCHQKKKGMEKENYIRQHQFVRRVSGSLIQLSILYHLEQDSYSSWLNPKLIQFFRCPLLFFFQLQIFCQCLVEYPSHIFHWKGWKNISFTLSLAPLSKLLLLFHIMFHLTSDLFSALRLISFYFF